jgi:hypothetical protein
MGTATFMSRYINNRNPTDESAEFLFVKVGSNTSFILTMGKSFVNDKNQGESMLFVLVDLSDKLYNELDGVV